MRTGRTLLRPAQRIIDLYISIIDWIYPPRCRICGEASDLTPYVCKKCFDQLILFDAAPDSITYHKDKPADDVKAMYLFDETLQTLIHEIKYKDASYIAAFLGERMGEFYKGTVFSDCDAIVPVPLYSARKRERTYNQSACIAKGLSKMWTVPVMTRLVKRSRNTGTQTKLNKKERQDNIKGAFKCKKGAAIPGNICIVDDVFTTGATTMELARILKAHGARKIRILCLATPPHEKST